MSKPIELSTFTLGYLLGVMQNEVESYPVLAQTVIDEIESVLNSRIEDYN